MQVYMISTRLHIACGACRSGSMNELNLNTGNCAGSDQFQYLWKIELQKITSAKGKVS